jgi:hypothetical protein
MEQKDYRNMVRELLELDEGLSRWEIEFTEYMDKWSDNYTDNQMRKIEQLWNKHF